MKDFNLAQLRHAWTHLDQGRPEAGKAVLASVIRSLENAQAERDSFPKKVRLLTLPDFLLCTTVKVGDIFELSATPYTDVDGTTYYDAKHPTHGRLILDAKRFDDAE